MNQLKKGNLIMKNVADKDIDMYVKAGWKLILNDEPYKKIVKNVKNRNKSNTIKK